MHIVAAALGAGQAGPGAAAAPLAAGGPGAAAELEPQSAATALSHQGPITWCLDSTLSACASRRLILSFLPVEIGDDLLFQLVVRRHGLTLFHRVQDGPVLVFVQHVEEHRRFD